GAQLHGTHRFELAVYPHDGDWSSGRMHETAEGFSYPLRATVARAHSGALPIEGAALTIEPRPVQLSALTKNSDTVTCRVYNASDDAVEASIRLGEPLREKTARVVGLLGDERETLNVRNGAISLPLKAWEIASITLR